MKNLTSNNFTNQQGAILLISLIMTSVIAAIGVSFGSSANTHKKIITAQAKSIDTKIKAAALNNVINGRLQQNIFSPENPCKNISNCTFIKRTDTGAINELKTRIQDKSWWEQKANQSTYNVANTDVLRYVIKELSAPADGSYIYEIISFASDANGNQQNISRQYRTIQKSISAQAAASPPPPLDASPNTVKAANEATNAANAYNSAVSIVGSNVDKIYSSNPATSESYRGQVEQLMLNAKTAASNAASYASNAVNSFDAATASARAADAKKYETDIIALYDKVLLAIDLKTGFGWMQNEIKNSVATDHKRLFSALLPNTIVKKPNSNELNKIIGVPTNLGDPNIELAVNGTLTVVNNAIHNKPGLVRKVGGPSNNSSSGTKTNNASNAAGAYIEDYSLVLVVGKVNRWPESQNQCCYCDSNGTFMEFGPSSIISASIKGCDNSNRHQFLLAFNTNNGEFRVPFKADTFLRPDKTLIGNPWQYDYNAVVNVPVTSSGNSLLYSTNPYMFTNGKNDTEPFIIVLRKELKDTCAYTAVWRNEVILQGCSSSSNYQSEGTKTTGIAIGAATEFSENTLGNPEVVIGEIRYIGNPLDVDSQAKRYNIQKLIVATAERWGFPLLPTPTWCKAENNCMNPNPN